MQCAIQVSVPVPPSSPWDGHLGADPVTSAFKWILYSLGSNFGLNPSLLLFSSITTWGVFCITPRHQQRTQFALGVCRVSGVFWLAGGDKAQESRILGGETSYLLLSITLPNRYCWHHTAKTCQRVAKEQLKPHIGCVEVIWLRNARTVRFFLNVKTYNDFTWVQWMVVIEMGGEFAMPRWTGWFLVINIIIGNGTCWL